MSFEKLTLQQRVSAANIDCMRHPAFCQFTAYIAMGKSEVQTAVKTACTNGRDKLYGAEFIKPLNRKQMRYLVMHENLHVALRHCTGYKAVSRKYPKLANIAKDYVVNGIIEELDPNFLFVERPTPTILIDPKYFGWSFPQVFNDLFKNGKGGGGEGGDEDGGGDFNEPIDAHEEMEFADEEAERQHEREIEDAARQGQLIAKRMAGKGSGGRDIFGTAAHRDTDWVSALQDWIASVSEGDDLSRFCPPNKRMLAAGFVMPSHFSESLGELVIACDTSGSMGPYYTNIFGEVARICETTKPAKVRVLWWDTSVCGDQEFAPGDYDRIASLLKPAGGGGTTPDVVVQYLKEKKINAKGLVWLTDGYIGCDTPRTDMPAIWGVVNNDTFVPQHGKVLHINVNV
jgi:predicted metal-dependent peptidase